MSDPAPSPGPAEGPEDPAVPSVESTAERPSDARPREIERPSDPRDVTATGRRASRGIGFAIIVGPMIGAVLGFVVGSLGFGLGTGAMWACVLGGAIVGLLLGGFWGGLATLGPPDPRDDPLPRTDENTDDQSGGSSVVG